MLDSVDHRRCHVFTVFEHPLNRTRVSPELYCSRSGEHQSMHVFQSLLENTLNIYIYIYLAPSSNNGWQDKLLLPWRTTVISQT